MLRKLIHQLPPPVLSAVESWRNRRQLQFRQISSIRQLERVAQEISGECLDNIRSLAEWQVKFPEIRRQLQWMLGLDPTPERTPLNARITGSLDRSEYLMQKLVFESLPGLYVTANYYLPQGFKRPAPCILYLCGHAMSPRGAKTWLQDRFLGYVRHGFACLVVDPLEFGEVPGIHHGTYNLNLWHWLSLGYTPAGVEVWNAMRALDWLESCPEIDSLKIGVTGISGGGAITWFLSALDNRVSAAVPSCSTYTIGSQASLGLVRKQCDCTFYPNIYQLDFPVVAALIAPRPVLITSGRLDEIFPPAGYREVFRRAKRIFDLYSADPGGSDRFSLLEARVNHTDPPLFLAEAQRWMQRWLRNEAVRPVETPSNGLPPLETASDLACLTQPPSRAANYSIHDRFVTTASVVIPVSRLEWSSRKETLMSDLRDVIFRWFPKKLIPFLTRRVRNKGSYVSNFARFRECHFETESGLPVRALVFEPKNNSLPTPLLVLVRNAGEPCSFPDIDELLPVLGSTVVIALNPRFTELLFRNGEYADIERTAAITGRTIAAMQVWDVVRAVRWALDEENLAPSRVAVYGHGAAGVVALYAAMFEERIDQVILNRPPSSHWDGPPLLTVLRFTDIPEVAGMLAPRTLTFLHEPAADFDISRKLYGIVGAPEKFQRESSLAEAVFQAN